MCVRERKRERQRERKKERESEKEGERERERDHLAKPHLVSTPSGISTIIRSLDPCHQDLIMTLLLCIK